MLIPVLSPRITRSSRNPFSFFINGRTSVRISLLNSSILPLLTVNWTLRAKLMAVLPRTVSVGTAWTPKRRVLPSTRRTLTRHVPDGGDSAPERPAWTEWQAAQRDHAAWTATGLGLASSTFGTVTSRTPSL